MTLQVRAIGCGLFALALSGCASILSGTTETVAFDSNPPGATCELTRQGTVIGSVVTPGTLQLDRSKYNIDLACRKDGYQDATGHLESGTEGMVLGNILLGGVVGWAVDSANGADNKYPAHLTVSLDPIATAGATTDATAAGATTDATAAGATTDAAAAPAAEAPGPAQP